MTLVDRLLQLLQHFGLERVHVAAAVPGDWRGLAMAQAERVASLSLVCPIGVDPAIASVAGRAQVIHGDRGPIAERVRAAVARMPEMPLVTLVGYTGLAWSDVCAERGAVLPEPCARRTLAGRSAAVARGRGAGPRRGQLRAGGAPPLRDRHAARVIRSASMMRSRPLGVLSAALVALLAATGCAPSPAPPSSSAVKRPVYVRDFLYDASHAAHQEERVIGGGEGPVRRLLQGRPISEDAAGRARRLAELLSKTIVRDLDQAGFRASRIASDAVPPADGWLIGGEFLEIDEGNRLRRAVVGFGAGQADVHVQVEVFDLPRDPRTPVLVYGTAEASRKAPGGAVMTAATHNPYAMAARYVLSRRATEDEVEKLGKKIAADLVKIAESQAPTPAR